MKIREIRVPGYERVLLGSDDAAGYQGIIAIHSTALGPAVGGTRYWNYKTEDDAITDALRLARGMTYKNALAGLPFGGENPSSCGMAKLPTANSSSAHMAGW